MRRLGAGTGGGWWEYLSGGDPHVNEMIMGFPTGWKGERVSWKDAGKRFCWVVRVGLADMVMEQRRLVDFR